MTKLLAVTAGYKTYTIVAVYLLCTFLELGMGWDVPNFEPDPNWIGPLLNMLGLGTLRAALPKHAADLFTRR